MFGKQFVANYEDRAIVIDGWNIWNSKNRLVEKSWDCMGRLVVMIRQDQKT